MKRKCLVVLLLITFCIGSIPNKITYADELPEKYRTKEVTVAKDQSSSNLCWAFASVSAMETELMKNNGIDNLDFSEVQLAYFGSNPAMDPLGQHTRLFSGSQIFDAGSTAVEMLGILASGVSPVHEAEAGVTVFDISSETKLDASLSYTSKYYLKEGKILRDASREEIKRAIMEYGSIVVDYDGNSSYFNLETNGWYNPDSNQSNHAVCIVGWDDTYSKDNFLRTPEGDGAWIVKNSWGPEWGEEGFFYLSYYDKALLSRSGNVVFDMEPGSYSDNIYQNAFSVSNGFQYNEEGKPEWSNDVYMNSIKVANVFTTQANEEGAECLKAVSIFTQEAGNYTIDIYKNVKESINPESGILSATVKGTFSVPGYQLIPLTTALYLSEGESFSVVVNMVNEEGMFIGVGEGSGENTLAALGQSYSYSDGRWFDYGSLYGKNYCINAYTDNIKRDEATDAKKVIMETRIIKNDVVQNVEQVSVSHVDGNSAILSWSKTPHNYYVIYKYNTVSGTWQKVGFSNKTYYKVMGLLNGEEYLFGVKAIGQREEMTGRWMPFFESNEFAKVNTQTLKVDKVTPKVSVCEQGAVLTWEKNNDATKYSIFVMSPFTDYEWTFLKDIDASEEMKYIDTNVLGGVTYSYRINAIKGDELLSKGIPVSICFE